MDDLQATASSKRSKYKKTLCRHGKSTLEKQPIDGTDTAFPSQFERKGHSFQNTNLWTHLWFSKASVGSDFDSDSGSFPDLQQYIDDIEESEIDLQEIDFSEVESVASEGLGLIRRQRIQFLWMMILILANFLKKFRVMIRKGQGVSHSTGN